MVHPQLSWSWKSLAASLSLALCNGILLLCLTSGQTPEIVKSDEERGINLSCTLGKINFWWGMDEAPRYSWLQKSSAQGELCDLCCCTPGATGSRHHLLMLGVGRGQHIIQFILALGAVTLPSSTDRGALAPCFWKCCLSFVCNSLERALSRGYPTSPSLFPVAVLSLYRVIYSKIVLSSAWFPGSQWTRQHWKTMEQVAQRDVDASFLEIFKDRLDRALSNLF